MNLRRMASHLLMIRWQVRQAFPESCLEAIERAIRATEAEHGGEICFVVEGALHGTQLMRGMPARERALEVFAQLRVWDTEHNNGVLIYILLADHAVEIVADRQIHAKAGTAAWQAVSHVMQECFERHQFEQGSLLGIRGVAAQLAAHYPEGGPTRNELPDRPLLL
jgi:uncharacterized membrane protein